MPVARAAATALALLVVGCAEPTVTTAEEPLTGCPAGGALLGTCQGSCTWTPNGNDETQTNFWSSRCVDTWIVCTYDCSWVYNPGVFKGTCTKGTPVGSCPTVGPTTASTDVRSSKGCDATTAQITMDAYCAKTYGWKGVPPNGDVDIACAKAEAAWGTLGPQAQGGLCCGD